MEKQKATHGFGPVVAPTSRILILGSFPSVESRKEAFFYMHPTNRFWPVLSTITGKDFVGADKDTKIRYLHEENIALYDVVESCTVKGSADSSLEDIVVADLEGILEPSRIRHIFLNGTKAWSLFVRFFPERMAMATKLPSTSSANARFRLDDLISSWRVIVDLP